MFHRAAVGQRNTLVETKKLAAATHLLGGRLVVDDDLDVAHLFAEFRGEAVHRPCDESREAGLPEA